MKKYLMVGLLLFAVVACKEQIAEEKEQSPEKVHIIITASKETDDATKVQLNGTTYVWNAGDQFGVFFLNNNAVFTLIGSGGTSSGNFSGSLLRGTDNIYAYYPYNIGYSWGYEDFGFDLTNQYYTTTADFAKYSYMAGVKNGVTIDNNTKTINVTLHALMTVINVKFNNFESSEIVAKSIELQARSTSPFITKGNIDFTTLTTENFPVSNTTTAQSIFLKFGENGAGMTMAVGEEKTVPFVIAPVTISERFQIVFHYTLNGVEMTHAVMKNGMTFSRNGIYSTDLVKQGVTIIQSPWDEGAGLNGAAE